MSLIFIPAPGASPTLPLYFNEVENGSFTLNDANGSDVTFAAPFSTDIQLTVNNCGLLSVACGTVPVTITSDATIVQIFNASPSELTLILSEVTNIAGGSLQTPAIVSIEAAELLSIQLWEQLQQCTLNGCPNLTTVTVPPLGQHGLEYLAINGAALSQATVDAIIIWANYSTVFAGTLDLSGGTSASPSGDQDVQTSLTQLAANSWTVLTN